jgi:hypothetical protein
MNEPEQDGASVPPPGTAESARTRTRAVSLRREAISSAHMHDSNSLFEGEAPFGRVCSSVWRKPSSSLSKFQNSTIRKASDSNSKEVGETLPVHIVQIF